jgi:hypothetical protein
MRKVMVLYKDPMDFHTTEYECGPYAGTFAKDVQRNLSLMGCTDFKVVPFRKKVVNV